MKMLTRDVMPCWYEVGWLPVRPKPTIVLRIHKDYVKHIRPVDEDMPMVSSYSGVSGLRSFQGKLDRDFGFNNTLKFMDAGEFIEFRALLPRIKFYTEESCFMCKGSGWEQHGGEEKCFSCQGYGREHRYDWKKLHPISISLSILLELLAYPEQETSSTHQQLMEINLMSHFSEDRHIFGVGGTYGIQLVRWLNTHPRHTTILEMVEAMRVAYYQMMTKDHVGPISFDRFSASVDYENGWLNVSCPGDACGLNPHFDGIRAGRGYEFGDHNVDNPVQQLTLLAGLAALHEKVRGQIDLSLFS